MKVSILIPAYNAESTIAETIQSALNQTHEDVEIIVYDDASTDSTHAVAQQFKDRGNFSLYQHYINNIGVSRVRNRLRHYARGDYIQFLDADDILLPTAIAKKLKRASISSADVVYSDFFRFAGDQAERIERPSMFVPFDQASHDLELATTVSWAPPAAFLFSIEAVRRIQFRDDLLMAEDQRHIQDMAHAKFRFAKCAEVLCGYRENGKNSLSTRDRKLFLYYIYVNACQILTRWEEEKTATDDRIKVIARLLDYVARGVFQRSPDLFDGIMETMKRIDPMHNQRWAWNAHMLKTLKGFEDACQLLKDTGLSPEWP